MNLIVDIGNTLTKFATFKGQTLLYRGEGDWKVVKEFLLKNSIKNVIVSSVVKESNLTILLNDYDFSSFIELSSTTKVPIVNLYKSPKTLGDDRLANVVGAKSLYPNRNVLVIDAGTCIKFDAITSEGEYFGGAISPGLRMRFKALEHFTGKLPLIEPKHNVELIGDTSENSILSGVVNGSVAEIEAIIAQYKLVYENLTVILTGGDASFFDNELKSNIFVEHNLTLIGLNEILRYNTLA